MQKTLYKVNKGLDIKIDGSALFQTEEYHTDIYAIRPDDFHWITPKLSVEEGDQVIVGTTVFCSKDDERIRFVSPVSGKIERIVRGEKRHINHIIIKSDGKLNSETVNLPEIISKETIIDTLLKYGLWTFVRQRPFGCIADYRNSPKAIFISCFDSAPLAPDYQFILNGYENEFQEGINILSKLTGGKTYLCLDNKRDNSFFEKTKNVDIQYFSGPHPAGNVGTQINRISPINKGEYIWYIEPQYVATIGRLFLNRQLDFTKTIAVTGPVVGNPRYIKIINGASLKDAFTLKAVDKSGFETDETRFISGNILSGHKIDNECFIGYYDQQITIIKEGGRRRVLGWMYPGLKLWSNSNTYLSKFITRKSYNVDTTLHGGRRVMMFSDIYDNVFPMDIMPMELLKACVTKDIDKMEELGIYEVTEEDFALCEVVCPSKTECQQIIYDGLTLIREQA